MKRYKSTRGQSPQQAQQKPTPSPEYDQHSEPHDADHQKALPSHIAYTVTEGKDRDYWHKVGAAWEGNHDSIKLNLHATPVNGEIILQSRERLEQLREERAQRQERSHNNTHDPSQ